jgi:outer membrane protein assembly factor BamD
VGVSVVSAPSGDSKADPLVKSVGPTNTTLPAAEAPAAAPEQINDVKAGSIPVQPETANGKKKKAAKADLSEESSSKTKKKKGLKRLNPF